MASERAIPIGRRPERGALGDPVTLATDLLPRHVAVLAGPGSGKTVLMRRIVEEAGAPVAWHSALFRPDKFKAVVGLSVPFRPRSDVRPTTAMPQTDNAVFYQLYFQKPGVAEAELEKDVRHSLRTTLFGGSTSPEGDSMGVGMLPREGGWLASRTPPNLRPSWITEADIDFYANEFSKSGFRGGLNWYRNIDRNWELLAPWSGAKVGVPALYIAGDRDLVVRFRGMDKLIPSLGQFVPQLQSTTILPGCGHWTQQERPEEVNAALIKFLKELKN